MSIHRRGKSYLVVWLEDGSQRSKFFGVRKYGQDAERLAQEWEASQKAVRPPANGESPSLLALVTMYVRAKALHHNTFRTIRYLMTGPAAPLAEIPADGLTRMDLEGLRERSLAAGASPATVNKHQAYLSAALAWGVEQGIIHIHPWAGVKKLKRQPRRPFNITLEDFQRIVAVAPEWLRWALAVAWATGNRPGHVELFNLEWSAINWRRGTMVVTQGKTGRTKEVLLPRDFMPEARLRFEIDRQAGHRFMIHRGDGRPIKSYRTAWLSSLRRAGLDQAGIRMYDLRHLVATHMLDAGVSYPDVAKRLGHSTPAVTASVYSHALDARAREAAESLPRLTESKKD